MIIKKVMARTMAFLFPQYSPIVYYPQSPPRIFGTSDELLFPRLLVWLCNWKENTPQGEMQYAKKAGYLISNTTVPADFIFIIKFRSSDEV